MKHVEGSASAHVVADSIYKRSRLVSVEVEFPRPYLAEFNTHRIFSRNSASSRAIPVWKRIAMCLERPYVPASFGKNQGRMQTGAALGVADQLNTATNWLIGRDIAVIQAYCLTGGRPQIIAAAKNSPIATALCDQVEDVLMKEYPDIGRKLVTLEEASHKQHANRPLELYSFHTVIVTSSTWRNFMGLRVSKMAQPEAQDFGIAISRAIMNSKPEELELGEWHLPYIRQDDRDEVKDWMKLVRISCGRCARTSYLTQDGIRSHEEDLRLTDKLQTDGHMSPIEHPGTPNQYMSRHLAGNFSSRWIQYRQTLPNEHDFLKNVKPEDLLIGCRNDNALAEFIAKYEEPEEI